MSYILDALRKSDQQRQRGAAPTLLVAQASAVEPKQTAFLSYGLPALLLVCAGVAIGWLRPWQAEQEAPAVQAVAAKPPELSPRAVAPEGQEMERAAQPELQLQRPTPVAQPAQASVKPKAPARARTETRSAPPKALAAVADEAASVPKESVVSAAADAARAQTPISMAELPASVQQELPAMTISVHAYSDKPGDRMVGINNRMLREGDSVVPGLKLEQITPDGMIFSYLGYNFRRGVK